MSIFLMPGRAFLGLPDLTGSACVKEWARNAGRICQDTPNLSLSPPHWLFSFTWHPHAVDPGTDDLKEPPTLVEFRLEKAAGGTSLTVTESGFDALPACRRDEAFRMNSAGWTEQMKNIEAHVAGPR